jgi:hypothetical protein
MAKGFNTYIRFGEANLGGRGTTLCADKAKRTFGNVSAVIMNLTLEFCDFRGIFLCRPRRKLGPT